MPAPDYKTTHPRNRQQWRQWLEKNHRRSPGIWLIYYKKASGKAALGYDEAVEEALCFGWIDSLPRKLDAERAMLKFTPRKPNSVWSGLNKSRVAKLIKAKRMSPAGLAVIRLAKQNGSWDTLSATDKAAADNVIPDDLEALFTGNRIAKENFTGFSVSVRRQFLYWIDSAKRPGTRQARLQQTVLMAEANRKPGPQGFKL